MVETVEVVDSRTGETVKCYYLDDAVHRTGYCRRTLERRVEEGELARLHHRGRTVHPVSQIERLRRARVEETQLFREGDRPGGATPPPKPRPNPNPRGGTR